MVEDYPGAVDALTVDESPVGASQVPDQQRGARFLDFRVSAGDVLALESAVYLVTQSAEYMGKHDERNSSGHPGSLLDQQEPIFHITRFPAAPASPTPYLG